MAAALDALSRELIAFTERVLGALTYERCQNAETSEGDIEFKGQPSQSDWRFFKWFILTLDENERGRYAWLSTEASDARTEGKGSSSEPLNYGAWIFEDGHVERFESPK